MIATVTQINEGKCHVHVSSDSEDIDLTEELFNLLRTLAKAYPEEYCEAIEMHQRFLERENNAKNNTNN